MALSVNRPDLDKGQGQFVDLVESLLSLPESIGLQGGLRMVKHLAGDWPVEAAAGAMVQLVRQPLRPNLHRGLRGRVASEDLLHPRSFQFPHRAFDPAVVRHLKGWRV